MTKSQIITNIFCKKCRRGTTIRTTISLRHRSFTPDKKKGRCKDIHQTESDLYFFAKFAQDLIFVFRQKKTGKSEEMREKKKDFFLLTNLARRIFWGYNEQKEIIILPRGPLLTCDRTMAKKNFKVTKHFAFNVCVDPP